MLINRWEGVILKKTHACGVFKYYARVLLSWVDGHPVARCFPARFTYSATHRADMLAPRCLVPNAVVRAVFPPMALLSRCWNTAGGLREARSDVHAKSDS